MATALTKYQDELAVVDDAVTAPSRIENDMAVLTLNNNGMIRECNEASGRMFGCPPNKLVWRHISTLLPQLAGIALMQGDQINPRLRFLSHIGYHFEAIGKSGVHFASELFFSDMENVGRHYLRVIICPASEECRQ